MAFPFVSLVGAGAQAAEYSLPATPENRLIGQVEQAVAAHEDTLLDIARRHGLGVQDIKLANPHLDTWLPGEDQAVLLPNRFVLPDAPRKGMVLNIPEMRLYYFPSDQPDTVITHPLGIGREGWETPYMQTRIIEKKKDPNWYPPASIRKEHEEAGWWVPWIRYSGCPRRMA